jgi:predicted small secreted protein
MKRAALAAASALSLAAVLTACSGDSGTGTDAKPESSPSSQKARQVSPAERLAQTMVTKADVSGYAVKDLEAEFRLAKSPSEVTLDKPACAPLAYAMNQLPLGEPEAELTKVLSTSKYGDEDVYITLTAYKAGKAQSAMAGLSKALDDCGDGFTAKSKNSSSTYDSVTAEKPTAVAAGDETVAFKATMTFRGASHVLHTEAVRRGDVVAVYFSVNGIAIANVAPSDAKMPAAVVKTQNEKLG